MDVIFLVLNTVGKGTFWRALAFAQSMNRLGHHATLVATSESRRSGMRTTTRAGVTVVETPDLFSGSFRSGWDPWNTLHRIAWAHGRQVDLVHAFEQRPTVLAPALYMKFARRTPFVSDWADWFGKGGSVEERPNPIMRAGLRPIETFLETRFRAQGLGVTTICTLLRDKALALGFADEKVLVLPNGSDTERYYPLDRNAALSQTALSPHHHYIGYLGSIFRQDAELMAQAFDRVHDQNPQARLLIMGACPVDIRQLVQTPSAVIQTGYLDSAVVNAYYSSCDLLWLPLRNSNANRGRWPMKFNDYLAAGRPIVATCVGDVPAYFKQESVGRITTDAPEPFAKESLDLLASPDLCRQLGRNARHMAESCFDWDGLTEKLLEFYATMLAKSA